MNNPFLIPALPLAAFLLNLFWGKRLAPRAASLISIAASLGACTAALPLILRVLNGEILQGSFRWLAAGKNTLSFGYLVDPLSASLLFVVTVVGTLIQIYASGYMQGDKRFSRFFAYVSLFMAAMLTLVIADNFLLFFMAWEIMGLCSYLLIGFWFEKDSAANAAKKAFLTTRLGDIGLFLGILTLFVLLGSLQFADLASGIQSLGPSPLLLLAALLIFCGTLGKSAQFPLHVWLPDAMEGPTPVSALIHAATMVAAGVYLIVRSFPLLAAAPDALTVIAWIGTLTAFMTAFIALSATDIKKVLAYSTISQLGFMTAAVGLGNPVAAMFHLLTHAFFKALLFMGAGSVIHGSGTQDIRSLGGLLKKMPSTGWTFFIACLAIAGVPPLSGFWSKDEILVAAHHAYPGTLYPILLLTAFMTAFYMFRLFFLTFTGKPRDSHLHPHESPASMTLPLWILAFFSITAGIPGSPWMHHFFQNFISGHHHDGGHTLNMLVMLSSIAAGIFGILTAALFYFRPNPSAEKTARLFHPLYVLSSRKFFIDEIYTFVFIRPFRAAAEKLSFFDHKVVDRLVNESARGTNLGAKASGLTDRFAVDGLVNLTGVLTQLSSAVLRRIQTGLVQNYLLIVLTGVIGLLVLGLR